MTVGHCSIEAIKEIPGFKSVLYLNDKPVEKYPVAIKDGDVIYTKYECLE